MNLKSISSKLKGNPTMIDGTVYSMLIICSISHFLNDMIQSIIPSIYPIVKAEFGFSFAQIGIITLMFQMTSSILQPFTGLYADKHPRPYALSVGMCFTLVGLLLLAFAENYFFILLAVSIVGLGSSVFHPTASRVAQLASGGKKSLAQSIFQVGGNGGSAVGPLLAALIILPFGQHAISWFALAALLAAIVEGTRTDGINLIALFDNEEIGNTSKQGAASILLHDMVKRIYRSLGCSEEETDCAMYGGMLLSVDVAHALHPNHKEKMDITNHPVLGDGFCIKEACSQSYATDAKAIGILRQLCDQNKIAYQRFVNRSDVRGGGTLGSVASTLFPVRTVDIGIPLLSMHSARELMGRTDFDALASAVTAYFS